MLLRAPSFKSLFLPRFETAEKLQHGVFVLLLYGLCTRKAAVFNIQDSSALGNQFTSSVYL